MSAPHVAGFPRPGRLRPPRAEGRTRLSLTSRAPGYFRRHAARDAVRVTTLAVADGITLALVWTAAVALLSAAGADRAASTVALPAGQFIGAGLLALALFGCYGSGDQRRDLGALATAAGVGTVLALWQRLWEMPLGETLPVAVGVAVSAAALLMLERRIVDWMVRLARPGEKGVMRAVVVGRSEDAARVIDHPAVGATPWCRLAAFIDLRRHRDNAADVLARLVNAERLDTVIIAGRLSTPLFAAVLDVAGASGCQVFSLPRLPPTSTFLPKVEWRNGYPVVELTRPGLLGAKLVVKRAMDLVVAGSLLIVTAPILALVALAVRCSSPGPVLFRQTRIGQGGVPFTIRKFRTMVADAERQRDALERQSVYRDGRLFKVINDPRVTRLGAFLRRTSLDELPQLWNVLVGDMSLVGPRPPLPHEVSLYAGHHYARFDVKPGITGPWQVSGRNTIRDFEQVVRLETAYIRRWNIWLDLELLARTVPAVLTGRGAH